MTDRALDTGITDRGSWRLVELTRGMGLEPRSSKTYARLIGGFRVGHQEVGFGRLPRVVSLSFAEGVGHVLSVVGAGRPHSFARPYVADVGSGFLEHPGDVGVRKPPSSAPSPRVADCTGAFGASTSGPWGLVEKALRYARTFLCPGLRCATFTWGQYCIAVNYEERECAS